MLAFLLFIILLLFISNLRLCCLKLLQLPDFLAMLMRNPGNCSHYISEKPTLGETALTKQSIFAHLSSDLLV